MCIRDRIDPDRPAEGLSIADQQIIEIAKAISLDARVLIMDEPTAALSGVEVDRLFAVARSLRDAVSYTHLDVYKRQGVRHVQHAAQTWTVGGGRQQRHQLGVASCGLPGPKALTEHPQTHHVLQVSDGAVDAEFVGEVGRPALLGENGGIEFQTHQRPRA